MNEMIEEIDVGLAQGEVAITRKRHQLSLRRRELRSEDSNRAADQKKTEQEQLEREMRITLGLRSRLQTIRGHLADLRLQVDDHRSISNANRELLDDFHTTGSCATSMTLKEVTGSRTFTDSATTLESITVTPADPTIPNGGSQQFAATGHYTDNSTQDLTDQVTWQSHNPYVAAVSNFSGSQGLAASMDTGTCRISAVFGDVMGSTLLTVEWT